MPELDDILAVAKIRINPAAAPVNQVYNDVQFLPITVFTEADVDRGTGLSPVSSNGTISVSLTELYEVGFVASVAFDRGDELALTFLSNGNPSGAVWHAQGLGRDRPVLVNASTIVEVASGTILSVGARNADNGNISVDYDTAAFYVRKV